MLEGFRKEVFKLFVLLLFHQWCSLIPQSKTKLRNADVPNADVPNLSCNSR
jgi:hypothetical protein